jgi:hypothetical protein
MKNLGMRLSAATGLAVAFIGWASLTSMSPGVNQADQGCPYDWVYDTYWGHCHPPGLPGDPPNGCLTGNGTHFIGTICVN